MYPRLDEHPRQQVENDTQEDRNRQGGQRLSVHGKQDQRPAKTGQNDHHACGKRREAVQRCFGDQYRIKDEISQSQFDGIGIFLAAIGVVTILISADVENFSFSVDEAHSGNFARSAIHDVLLSFLVDRALLLSCGTIDPSSPHRKIDLDFGCQLLRGPLGGTNFFHSIRSGFNESCAVFATAVPSTVEEPARLLLQTSVRINYVELVEFCEG